MAAAVPITRTDLDAAGLRRAAQRSRDAAAARRMLALALVLEGASRTQAAKAAGMERQTLRDWVHRYNARGTGAGLVLPFANAEMMNLHLAEISACVAPGAHAVLVLDGAGWHQRGGRLRVPANITLLSLPAYS